MIKRTAGFLLVLLLSACQYLPTEPPISTPTCPAGVCLTEPARPTTIVVTPTSLFPQTPPTDVPTPTDTPSPEVTEPGEPTSTLEFIESETPFLPTGMAELTSTATAFLSSTPGPLLTNTPVPSDKFYVLQEGTPRRIQNFSQPSAGCQWMGAAGQVFGAGGIPMKNMVVVITGELNGESIDKIGLTGLSAAYGSGGYEIQISNHTLASTATFYVQLFDLNGMELSDPYPFDTSADCSQNLIIINFVANT